MYNFWQNDPSRETFVETFTLPIYSSDPIWLHSPAAYLAPFLSLLSKPQKSQLVVNPSITANTSECDFSQPTQLLLWWACLWVKTIILAVHQTTGNQKVTCCCQFWPPICQCKCAQIHTCRHYCMYHKPSLIPYQLSMGKCQGEDFF